jgi:ribose transport system ATP-binding protein
MSPTSGSPPILETRGITKRFSGVCALADVDFAVRPGEVHAVIGENGAGKTTLMKILAGVQMPDSGQVLMDGKPVVVDSVHTALDLGIVLIHQELNLSDNLDVGANIFLGREPRRFGCIDFADIRKQAQYYLDMVALDVDPATVVSQLAIGRQQMVEIAKALSVNARILIMDEPTSSLSRLEAENLFNVIRQLQNQGVAIVYISHRLGEVREIADRVSVLRDGENAGSLSREEIDHDRMVQLMVGRDISQFYVRREQVTGEPELVVKDIRTTTWPQHRLSFEVHAGEMVGLAGLVGAGRSEVMRALFGIDPLLAGEVRLQGRKLALRGPGDAIEAGLALVPEDRKQQGLILEMGIRENIGLAGLRRHRQGGAFLNRSRERDDANRMLRDLMIKAESDRQLPLYLSGGNQQKVVLGKWLVLEPHVLLLDEPTRGVDVGAKQVIYRLMEEFTERGMAILFVSSEMEEVLSMSDRTLVMHEGRIAGELQRHELSEESVMQLATGRSDVPV